MWRNRQEALAKGRREAYPCIVRAMAGAWLDAKGIRSVLKQEAGNANRMLQDTWCP